MASGTCAENCWYAKEMECHCQCDGKNHGILLVDGAETPVRTKRVKSRVYKLASIHTSYYEASKVSHAFLWPDGKLDMNRDTIVQTVNADRCKWPEVKPFFGGRWNEATLVWTFEGGR